MADLLFSPACRDPLASQSRRTDQLSISRRPATIAFVRSTCARELFELLSGTARRAPILWWFRAPAAVSGALLRRAAQTATPRAHSATANSPSTRPPAARAAFF